MSLVTQANRILRSIKPDMSKDEILSLVSEAIPETEFLTAEDMALALGWATNTVRSKAAKYNIGQKASDQGRGKERFYSHRDFFKFLAIPTRKVGRPRTRNCEKQE